MVCVPSRNVHIVLFMRRIIPYSYATRIAIECEWHSEILRQPPPIPLGIAILHLYRFDVDTQKGIFVHHKFSSTLICVMLLLFLFFFSFFFLLRALISFLFSFLLLMSVRLCDLLLSVGSRKSLLFHAYPGDRQRYNNIRDFVSCMIYIYVH